MSMISSFNTYACLGRKIDIILNNQDPYVCIDMTDGIMMIFIILRHFQLEANVQLGALKEIIE